MNTEERLVYLKEREVWNALPEALLQTVATSFSTANEDHFLQFVTLAEKFQLPEGKLKEIIEKEGNADCYAYLLATAIHEVGTKIMAQSMMKPTEDQMVITMLCHYFSTCLSPNYFPGHLSMAGCYSRVGNKEEALDWLKRGEETYNRLKNAPSEELNRYESLAVQSFDESLIGKLREDFSKD